MVIVRKCIAAIASNVHSLRLARHEPQIMSIVPIHVSFSLLVACTG